MPSRATSDIEVAQRAAAMAGMTPMRTWEDPDPQTIKIKSFYEDLVTGEITGHDWKFATADQTLQLLEAEPLYGFKAAYQLPTDPAVLHVKAIHIGDQPARWRVSQDKVYVDANDTDDVILTGQFRQPVNIWPPFFTIYMETRLAAWISATITRNGSLADEWTKLADELLPRARTRDAQQQTAARLPIGRYTAVRRGART